jgi:hypothetical protein
MVEEEINYGRHHEVIGDFSLSERQLYEAQEFESTATGFLMKKRHIQDSDYEWDVLAFIKNNPDLADKVKAILDSGERLLRQIYTDRETFLTWLGFFERLNDEGYDLDDHVEMDEMLSAAPETDAFCYTDTGLSIETVGERAIYHIEGEIEENEDWLGELIDPYKTNDGPPRDRYRTVAFIGFNEPEPEGKLHAWNRQQRERKLLAAFNGLHHRPYVAKLRNRMSSMWNEDKKLYAALKNRQINLDNASEQMHLTADQWKNVFKAADHAWKRACLHDEQYYTAEAKNQRRIRSNTLRDKLKAQILQAATSDQVHDIMKSVNFYQRISFLWKYDYKDTFAVGAMQWRLLHTKEEAERLAQEAKKKT